MGMQLNKWQKFWLLIIVVIAWPFVMLKKLWVNITQRARIRSERLQADYLNAMNGMRIAVRNGDVGEAVECQREVDRIWESMTPEEQRAATSLVGPPESVPIEDRLP